MKKQKCLSKWLRYDPSHCFETHGEAMQSLSRYFREIQSLQLPITRVHKRKAPSPSQKTKTTNTLLNYFSKKQKTTDPPEPPADTKPQHPQQMQQQQQSPALTRRVQPKTQPPLQQPQQQSPQHLHPRMNFLSPPQTFTPSATVLSLVSPTNSPPYSPNNSDTPYTSPLATPAVTPSTTPFSSPTRPPPHQRFHSAPTSPTGHTSPLPPPPTHALIPSPTPAAPEPSTLVLPPFFSKRKRKAQQEAPKPRSPFLVVPPKLGPSPRPGTTSPAPPPLSTPDTTASPPPTSVESALQHFDEEWADISYDDLLLADPLPATTSITITTTPTTSATPATPPSLDEMAWQDDVAGQTDATPEKTPMDTSDGVAEGEATPFAREFVSASSLLHMGSPSSTPPQQPQQSIKRKHSATQFNVSPFRNSREGTDTATTPSPLPSYLHKSTPQQPSTTHTPFTCLRCRTTLAHPPPSTTRREELSPPEEVGVETKAFFRELYQTDPANQAGGDSHAESLRAFVLEPTQLHSNCGPMKKRRGCIDLDFEDTCEAEQNNPSFFPTPPTSFINPTTKWYVRVPHGFNGLPQVKTWVPVGLVWVCIWD